VLLPLQPLHLSFGGDGEIRTLKGAEWVGGHVMPTGDALLSGYYLNELLLRLLARDDPHPGLFDAYASVVQVLAGHGSPTGIGPALEGEVLHVALRAFELLLLREIGLLPLLDAQTLTLEPLAPEGRYCLVPEGGLREFHDDDRASLRGAEWESLQAALGEGAAFLSVLRASGPLMSELRPQLRALLNYHCGVTTLRTRQMMMDLQNL
jgi:DNA repair protein RecO (recombination protein O)